MPSVIFSIKPEYCYKIFSQIKKYEYRKTRLAKENVAKILIYCTSPISKIVGEAQISNIICDTPLIVWDQTKNFSGITKDYFYKYFNNSEKAIAYELTRVIKYSKPLSLQDFGLKVAPQSYAYVDVEESKEYLF
jgi:predicted transcriptional regulator